MTPRDSAIYKRISALLRFTGGHQHGGSGQADDAPSQRALLQSSKWTPFSPRIHASNGPTFASTWESDTGNGEAFIAVVGFGNSVSSSPPPPTPACSGTLRGCWPVQNDTQKCSACEVRQQNHLHAAGCTEADIEAYCGVLTDDAFTDAWFLLDAKYVTARTHRLRFSASLLEFKVALINY